MQKRGSTLLSNEKVQREAGITVQGFGGCTLTCLGTHDTLASVTHWSCSRCPVCGVCSTCVSSSKLAEGVMSLPHGHTHKARNLLAAECLHMPCRSTCVFKVQGDSGPAQPAAAADSVTVQSVSTATLTASIDCVPPSDGLQFPVTVFGGSALQPFADSFTGPSPLLPVLLVFL